MNEIRPGWWRTLLKDKVTNLYARVDVIKRGDGELAINVNLEKLAAQISIVFSDGSLVISAIRITEGEEKEVWREEMQFDGKFTWKEGDNSNKG